jgi:PAS domain S-box-containing protein
MKWLSSKGRKKAPAAKAKPSDDDLKLNSLTQNIPGAVYRCACNKDWSMHYISDGIEVITGFPASDFVDDSVRTYASIIHAEDRAKLEQAVVQSIKTGQPYAIEYRILNKEDKVRWVYERGQIIRDAEDQIAWLDGVIFDFTEHRALEEEKEALFLELRTALKKIKQLHGLLPICTQCKKIRDDKGYWSQLENYIQEHSEAIFTHGLCPNCIQDLYKDEEWFKRSPYWRGLSEDSVD